MSIEYGKNMTMFSKKSKKIGNCKTSCRKVLILP